MFEILTGSLIVREDRLAAAEFDAKVVAGHRLDGSHPNLMEI
jgi:hypothetical protein